MIGTTISVVLTPMITGAGYSEREWLNIVMVAKKRDLCQCLSREQLQFRQNSSGSLRDRIEEDI